MDSNTLRQKFLDFFRSKEHIIIPSSSLVPKDDPTVLFTSAGMNQFKDNFLGKVKTLKRAASCQRCLRTADLDNVGKTAGHHSFFEMLGNFSFGNYFKKETIIWAWEFLKDNLKISKEKLWCSVYEKDDESYDIWANVIKIPKDKIMRFGQKQNFWPSNAQDEGPNGPCGPCSEIFFDQGESLGCGRPNCSPACDCGRFVEIWNLVFTQFNRKDGGILEPLPNKNIDTGMGLERLARIMQGARTNFETDLFKDIVSFVEKNAITKNDIATKAVGDHIRAAIFAIFDGVMPSNEGRGYVVRMLIRRSINFSYKIGIVGPFLYKIVPIVARVMKVPYPELEARRENISDVILSEEKKYEETIRYASSIFVEEIGILKQKGIKDLPKELVFKFYDTYGLPLDTIEEISKNNEMDLDKKGFQDLLARHKDASRKSSAISANIFAETLTSVIRSLNTKTEFLGYDKYENTARIKAIIVNEKLTDEISNGQTGYVITDKTPFYGEQGGQIGDTGILEKDSVRCKIIDTKIIDNITLHLTQVSGCSLKREDAIYLKIDVNRRQNIAKHHSATHLLQAALREVLGPHVEQSGSLVTDEFFRFDFSHFKDLSLGEINRIEDVVNSYIRSSIKLSADIMELEEARSKGAIALFGEKYDRFVRVVSIGSVSKELCGGTHVNSTGEIGLFKIISEGAIGTNMRRIEAVVG
ncbi:MAG: alanine--tRNA ligase, partial [Candidatus Omnitrophica bacterium]|nr:alanine--tRNA ligase [Candidatus Omnitrophota bacterium]